MTRTGNGIGNMPRTAKVVTVQCRYSRYNFLTYFFILRSTPYQLVKEVELLQSGNRICRGTDEQNGHLYTPQLFLCNVFRLIIYVIAVNTASPKRNKSKWYRILLLDTCTRLKFKTSFSKIIFLILHAKKSIWRKKAYSFNLITTITNTNTNTIIYGFENEILAVW